MHSYLAYIFIKDAHQFIMWSHKESWRIRSKHRISLNNKKIKRYDAEYLAKLKTNLLGTQATLYDCIFNKGKSAKRVVGKIVYV